MVQEKQVTAWAFGYAVVFYVGKRLNDPIFTTHIFEISTYALIFVSTLFILASINNLKLLYGPLVGLIAFNTVYLGVLLAATKGLGSTSFPVIEGLSRVVVALCATWKLSSDMRNLSLKIDPFHHERSKVRNIFYGILFPPREFARLIKVLGFVVFSFYLIFSGLDLLSQAPVDLLFFKQTEKLSLNIVFFGIQAPMMMASRASISKTFSEYLKNLDWAESITGSGSSINTTYRNVLHSNEISYDAISSNGKHIWLTILLMIILQAYQKEIISLDIFNLDYIGILTIIITSIKQIFGKIL